MPKAQATGSSKKTKTFNRPVPAPVNALESINERNVLELILVSESEEMRIWNELMIEEHPLGAGPFMERQLRYLIRSESGWFGGGGFAVPALQLADRDSWIGWSQEERQASLHYIVGMCRFLIRPSVVWPQSGKPLVKQKTEGGKINFLRCA